MIDLDREQDIEELRRIAQAQQAQIRILLDALAIKSKEIDALKGKPGDVQLTLKMLEALQAKAKAADDALAKAEAAHKAKHKAERKPRTSSGPTEQPNLPTIEKEFVLDEADRTCLSCGGGLSPMKGQYDESEMIDVVEVSYRLVKVKQQKYVCRCGSCVETALGPERALAGSRYSLAFAIKVILDKWLDHIPLERQVRIVERHGLVVTSQTLWDLAYAGSLRKRFMFRALREATFALALRELHDREGESFRIVHISIQRDHVHLLVEAGNKVVLSRGMQSFQISAAKHLNREFSLRYRLDRRRRGTVFPDRFHQEIIKTPKQARHTLAYVLNNWRKHREDRGELRRTWLVDPFSSAVQFCGWKELEGADAMWKPRIGYEAMLVYLPKTWLLRVGWKIHGLIGAREVPGPARTRAA